MKTLQTPSRTAREKNMCELSLMAEKLLNQAVLIL